VTSNLKLTMNSLYDRISKLIWSLYCWCGCWWCWLVGL